MMKFATAICLFIGFFTIILSGCQKEPDVPEPAALKSIQFDFESSLTQWHDLGGSGERYHEEDIVLSHATALSGNHSCRFRVTPESYIGKGNRAELTFDQQARAGDESWYQWSVFIPGSYQDVWLEDENGAPNWQVIGQWHQQPDFENGEDWENYPSKGKSVPIAFNYYYFDKEDPEYVKLCKDPRINHLYGMDTSWNNVSAIGLSVGDPPEAVAIHRIEKDQWYTLKIHIQWSENDDGYVEAWINQNPFTDGRYYGKNMLNDQSHYFKFGLYRNPGIPYTHTIYYDDVMVY